MELRRLFYRIACFDEWIHETAFFLLLRVSQRCDVYSSHRVLPCLIWYVLSSFCVCSLQHKEWSVPTLRMNTVLHVWEVLDLVTWAHGLGCDCELAV